MNKQPETYSLDKNMLELASDALVLLEMPPRIPAFSSFGPPPDDDAEVLGGVDVFPPEVLEILDKLDVSPHERIESVMSGDTPKNSSNAIGSANQRREDSQGQRDLLK